MPGTGSIVENFKHDNDFLIKSIQEHLDRNINPLESSEESLRNQAIEALSQGDFTKTLQTLEQEQDRRNGIVHIITKSEDPNIAPILIRDARAGKTPSNLSTESFEMQYLNTIRAAIDISKLENKPQLEASLLKQAQSFMDPTKGFNTKHHTESQKAISKHLKKEIGNIATFLGVYGIKNPHKALDMAKDFQNYNDTHYNIVTISSISDKKGKKNIVIEAETALKGLTNDQIQEYEKINGSSKPAWFEALSSLEKKLASKYAKKITEGKHVMPTQLRQLVGMKNAFEKATMVLDDKGQLQILHTSKHAGTLASLSHAKGDEPQRITNLNADQAKVWVGNAILHANTLNSGIKLPFIKSDDPKIVALTSKAMEGRGAWTGTAFNTYRKISSRASDLTGSKDFLKNFAESINDENIRSHLKPRGFVSRIFGFNKPRGNLDDLLSNQNGLTDAEKTVIKDAAKLARNIEGAESSFLWDPENLSLKVSTGLSLLSSKIRNLSHSENSIINYQTLLKHAILKMCASGKDRTALAIHDESAQALSHHTGVNIDEIDRVLLSSRHAAQQAGGIFAGGATIGCFGTKEENRAGLPVNRELEAIIEVSAQTNKIKEKSFLQKLFKRTASVSTLNEVTIASLPTEVPQVIATKTEIAHKKSARNANNSSLVNSVKSTGSHHQPVTAPSKTPTGKASITRQSSKNLIT